jgi:hypothetical protein
MSRLTDLQEIIRGRLNPPVESGRWADTQEGEQEPFRLRER